MKRMQTESVDDSNAKFTMKKNPMFGAGGHPAAMPAYMSSDDDIPVGFSRRKRHSTHSGFYNQPIT